jgi:hypothetical protein
MVGTAVLAAAAAAVQVWVAHQAKAAMVLFFYIIKRRANA